ncbi:hypothetical protein GMA11_04790 [Granulicatella sp. zg-ZJ]|uniref:hypothetical protein n=1 Tax=unclassified Granulicatella TaxID=2630493 RepID=UPI0013C228BC|nr:MULTISPECIES: hypothetical protein [unclassified Granulicatella]MBS4749533.1 hypothetical protein [Carnobacteriaceae bacterium zg-ZUI78]NEW62706.1 hypothetical protein [Granulicatella sp. zg-ZJ]NEW65725.1 hypothetical protein [Granulicatella sp. zg-84]QMI86521.1 hypothetical protein H1220_04030 [Carnobacteriaceae bacterium zg-84]
MSNLSEQAIQSVENDVASLVSEYKVKMEDISRDIDAKIFDFKESIEQEISDYQQHVSAHYQEKLTQKRIETEKEIEQEIHELQEKIHHHKDMFVQRILEEVQTRYGSI